MSDRRQPCPLALSLTRVPVKRWATKADLITALEAARLELERNPDTARLEALGAEVGLSPHHLQRLFAATFGHSPRAYGERVRLLRAWSHLAAGMSVSETAITVGYDSPQQLARVFRRVMDCAPSEVRRLVSPD
ncbi:MAG: helix-turn-helix domain-containing protein [Chthonomonas sp.]|nr:helix-turn-helix domain-containing protein [Chthonomonas sp.]